jgi:hypothetical protein
MFIVERPALSRNQFRRQSWRFFSPFLIGWARQATGSFIAGLMISAVTLLASVMIVISLRRSAKISILQPTTQH